MPGSCPMRLAMASDPMPEREGDMAGVLFRKGHGGAHEPDEGLDLEKLISAEKIYTMAMLALNECDF